MNFKSKISKLHYDKNAKGLFVDMLEFFSIFYGLVTKLRNLLYDKKILKQEKVNARVISIGNLTTGGVGKTPLVAKLTQYFINNDEKVAVVMRGYGGTLSNKNINLISDGVNVYYDAIQAGDEAYWHAVNNPMSCVLTCKSRVQAARYAVENLGCTIIILDDGFQHRKLYRDEDIVLFDSKLCAGNEKLLPAGPLREGKEAYKRIDKVVVVNKGNDERKVQKIVNSFKTKFSKPVFVCKTKPDYIYNIISGEHIASGEPVTVVCAIGHPESFFNFIEDKLDIIDKVVFDDHHVYTEADLAKIKGTIVTTEKDAVKLMKFKRKNIYALKLSVDVDVKALLDR